MGHRNLPRAAPPDSWRSGRSARVPRTHYLDKLPRPRLGAGKNRRVRIKSANQPKVDQNSPGVDTVSTASSWLPTDYAVDHVPRHAHAAGSRQTQS